MRSVVVGPAVLAIVPVARAQHPMLELFDFAQANVAPPRLPPAKIDARQKTCCDSLGVSNGTL